MPPQVAPYSQTHHPSSPHDESHSEDFTSGEHTQFMDHHDSHNQHEDLATLMTLRPILNDILLHTTTLPMTMIIILIPKAMTTDPSAPPLSPYMTVLPTPRTSTLHILTLSP